MTANVPRCGPDLGTLAGAKAELAQTLAAFDIKRALSGPDVGVGGVFAWHGGFACFCGRLVVDGVHERPALRLPREENRLKNTRPARL